MRTVMALFVVLLFGVLGMAQQPKTETAKRNAPADSMQISQYMRETGLTYLEILDKAFDQASQDHIAYMYMKALAKRDGSYSFMNMPTGDSLTDNLYGKELTRLEDRIEINIKSKPDKKFLKFLQDTKSIAGIAYTEVLRAADPTYKTLHPKPTIAKLYPVCVGQAHGIIKSGILGYGSCAPSDFDAALRADDPKAAAEMDKQIDDANKKKQ